MTQTLITFAREPIAGRTKTRLCPPLDGAMAAGLYACFLCDVLDTMRRVPDVRRIVAHTPESHQAYFAELAPDFAVWPQRGAELGERMDHAFTDFGFEILDFGLEVERSQIQNAHAVIIGSDSPDLPGAYMCEAFARLERGADVVLGPAADGGYYLIGLRAPQPRLLREVPMSTPTVLADTLALARALGLRVELLPEWYDVDTGAELRRLAVALRLSPPDVAPHTRAFMQTLEAEHP
jgi:rSAM/selenodomain-associated transferase 1